MTIHRRDFLGMFPTLLGTLALGSCTNKYLGVYPTDQLTDVSFWKSENDARLALTGLYGQNPTAGPNKDQQWESHWNILWWDLMTDNGYSQFPWDNIQVMGNGQLSAANPGRNYYSYAQIRKCNNYIQKVDPIKMDDGRKAVYKAEARFLRAYDYFRKVQFYGEVPLVTEVIEDPAKAQLPVSPHQDIVDFILSELEDVAGILPVQNMRQSAGHATSGAALALKARLELYEGRYEDAMADAAKVNAMSVYALYPDYRGLFLIDNESQNTESILEVQYAQDTYSNNIWQHVLPAKEGGWSSISAVQSIVDAYEMKNGKPITDAGSGYNPDKPFMDRDPRLANTILYPGLWFNGRYFDSLDASSPDYHQLAAAPRSGYNVLKYSKVVPSSLLQNGGENVMVIRLAETLLTFAEAAIEANKITADVYAAIDKVRARAGMPPVDRAYYATRERLRELIRRERRVELAFEGLRYWDIKRWDIGAATLDGPLYGCREGSVNAQTGEVTWSSGRIKIEDRVFYPARKYLLPIPQQEIDANPQVKQNAGY